MRCEVCTLISVALWALIKAQYRWAAGRQVAAQQGGFKCAWPHSLRFPFILLSLKDC